MCICENQEFTCRIFLSKFTKGKIVMMPHRPWAAALLALVTLAAAQSTGAREQERGATLYAPQSETDRLFKPFQEIDLCLKNDGCTDPSLPFCVKQGLVRRCVQCR